MKKIKIIFFTIATFLLSGCAAIQEMTCTPDAAFSSGINDAQSGAGMSSNYALFCPAPMKASLNLAYRRGYLKGLQHTQHVIVNKRVFGPPPHYHHHHHHHHHWH